MSGYMVNTLISTSKCNNESVIAHSVPPVDGMAFMLCKMTATQSKTYLRRASKLRWRPI